MFRYRAGGRFLCLLALILSGEASVVAGAPAAAQASSFATFINTPEHPDLFPPECNGRTTPIPYAHALFLNGESVRLDGKLDDPVWTKAVGATGFRVSDPDRGAIPTEETTFKVAYDKEAVYFAVACLEKDPSKVTSHLSRRDNFSNSDLVSVYIDPYHDKTTGYNFKVNPEGVQMDSYVYNDGDQDQNWDAVWQAETYRDDKGWYVEMRIPFSTIRYRPSPDMTWGLQVYRYMHGRGEDTAWVNWDRTTRGFVSRFGELRDLRNVPAPRQLEILPYFVERALDPAVAEGPDDVDHLQKMGMDLKYGVTADLTMNGTIQPDFGQVEADPATLNLSPFETFYEEKRPFFIEGAKFFSHPSFNVFYSRRIGTGDENSRIRVAGKLTGKTQRGFSMGLLAATTDVALEGQAHNPFKSGSLPSDAFVGRLGKEWKDGNYKVNFMGTASIKRESRDAFEDPSDDEADLHSREAYTGGLDFDLNFKNRSYNITGSVVGTSVLHEASQLDSIPATTQNGSGGELNFQKLGGKFRGNVFGRWESDRLELNDLGFLSAPDEIVSGLWVQYRYNPEGKSKTWNLANLNYNASNSWLFGGRTGTDVATGDTVWAYGVWHPQRFATNVNGWGQLKSYWEAWFGVEYLPYSTQRFETRGGPLMGEPTTYGGWLGGSTDTRKNLSFNTEVSHYRDTVPNHTSNISMTLKWNQSSRMNHKLTTHFNYREDDTQYLETVDLRDRPGGQGIGGLSYVFGKIYQRTLDFTLRTSFLFSRNTSLEIYAQPYISVGDYSHAVELARPDSYDLIAYGEPGYNVADSDFSYTAVNFNIVYRWEYRPGSTIYLVWTQGRSSYDLRGDVPSGGHYENTLKAANLFASEPANTFLIKVSYWFPM
jgi:Domain of unknown function (DUF5916)/Carbohydrate family 9 binding domain-like